MGYINKITITDNGTHLIEPTLYAVASGTASAITASIDGFEAVSGVIVYITITIDNAANATLKINDAGTARPIYYAGDAITAGKLVEGRTYGFVYDGTSGSEKWILIDDDNANTLTHTLATTTKYYMSGTTLTTTGKSAATFDTGIYSTTTAGELSAARYSWNVNGVEKAHTEYDATNDCINFIFD